MSSSSQSPNNIAIRNGSEGDTDAIYNLVPDLRPLTQHTWYTYWGLFHNFGNSCFIAEDGNEPVGFITSHPSIRQSPEWFIWQAGILPEYRGRGLIDRLQDHVIERARHAGAIAITTTIEADNSRSFGAFNRMAVRLASSIEELQKFNTPFSDVPEVEYRIELNR